MHQKINRRAFCSMLLALPFPARAQQAGKIPRIAYLVSDTRSATSARVEAFRQGLRVLGYLEGQNIAIEWRFADGKLDRIPDLAAEIVSLKVDVIVTTGGPPTRAAMNATSSIPIVMINISDPVALGFVSSLAKPGGNVTGLSSVQVELGGKRLELLKEIIPKLSRVGVLVNREVPGYIVQMKEVKLAAQVLGLQLQELETRGRDDLEKVFISITNRRVGGITGLTNPTFTMLQGRIAELALKNRLPTIYGDARFPEAGGLMSYGPNSLDMWRRAAVFVDKIMKGTKPADLPVEQPMKFDFVINLQTAKKIGLNIPQSVLFRASKAIK
jgi:putative ABC transport system substrate-binding protein